MFFTHCNLFQVMSFTSELERQAGEQRSDLSHFRSDTNNRLNNIDDRSKANMMELRDMIEGNRSALNGYVDRLDTKFSSMINKATDGWSDIIVRVCLAHHENTCFGGFRPEQSQTELFSYRLARGLKFWDIETRGII